MSDLSSYRGRWVAVSGENLVAADDTAAGAYRAARLKDPAERFRLEYVAKAGEAKLTLAPLLDQIMPFLATEKGAIYLVGGAVRDALMGRVSKDLDFVVPRRASSTTFRLADAIGAPAYILDNERDTGRIVLQSEDTVLDLASYRGGDLLEDLQDRDFTINAIAMPAGARTRGGLIDPTNGARDLAAGILRLANQDAIQHDPVRALRAVRLATDLGLAMTPDTVEAVKGAGAGLQSMSAERVRDELLKMLEGPKADQAFGQLHDLGILGDVLPEISALADVEQSAPHHETVLRHTFSVLRWLQELERTLFSADPPPSPALGAAYEFLKPYLSDLRAHFGRIVDGGLDGWAILHLAALLHDAGKGTTMSTDEDGRIRFYRHAEAGAGAAATRLRYLAFSREARGQVERIVAQHMRPLLLGQALGAVPSRRAAYRYFRDSGINGLDVGILSLADHLATYNGPGDEESWLTLLGLTAALFSYYYERYDETIKPPTLVNGRDLMAHLDLSPGPEIGRLLRLIEENQAAGEIATREEALQFASAQYRH